jgi:hypothetical protein
LAPGDDDVILEGLDAVTMKGHTDRVSLDFVELHRLGPAPLRPGPP